jgi:hypothetical protein
MAVGSPLSFECDHVVLLCQICDLNENQTAHQSEISCETKKKIIHNISNC